MPGSFLLSFFVLTKNEKISCTVFAWKWQLTLVTSLTKLTKNEKRKMKWTWQKIHLKLCFDMKVHLKLGFDVKIQLTLLFDLFHWKLCLTWKFIWNWFDFLFSQKKAKKAVWATFTNYFLYFFKSYFGDLHFDWKNQANSFEIMFWREKSFEIMLLSCSRHRTTNFPNSESRIFTTKFLFWFF